MRRATASARCRRRRTSASRTGRSTRVASSRTSSGTCPASSSPPEADDRGQAARARSSAGSSARIDAVRAEVEANLTAFDFAAVARRSLPPHVRRLLRLVRRGHQATAPRARRGRRGNGAVRARAAAGAAPSGHAARDRGDLVAAPRQVGAPDRLGVAGRRTAPRPTRRSRWSSSSRRRRRSGAAACGSS